MTERLKNLKRMQRVSDLFNEAQNKDISVYAIAKSVKVHYTTAHSWKKQHGCPNCANFKKLEKFITTAMPRGVK
jgi:predicted peroxiredoxin